MNTLEIISLIFAIGILLKVLVFLVKPEWMLKIVDLFVNKTKILNILIVILMVVLGYFVLTTLTIIQVIPALWLGSMLFALMLIQYPKHYQKWVKVLLKDKKRVWFFWAIWLVIAGWILYVLFL